VTEDARNKETAKESQSKSEIVENKHDHSSDSNDDNRQHGNEPAASM
jgi:hypothetical protein